jgi:hypothetical protein
LVSAQASLRSRIKRRQINSLLIRETIQVLPSIASYVA